MEFRSFNSRSPLHNQRSALAFYGAPFLPGEYHERVVLVDLALMLASLVGVDRASPAVGRVVNEAITLGVSKAAGSDSVLEEVRRT